MLAEAGFDVTEYLEKEEDLHSEQDCLIADHHMGYERQLIFQMDGNPSIGWEWWFHPLSPGSSVCHEFRNMNLAHNTFSYRCKRDSWTDAWPYDYPEWSYYHEALEPIFPLVQKLQIWQETEVKPWQKLRDDPACRHISGSSTRSHWSRVLGLETEENKLSPL